MANGWSSQRLRQRHGPPARVCALVRAVFEGIGCGRSAGLPSLSRTGEGN